MESDRRERRPLWSGRYFFGVGGAVGITLAGHLWFLNGRKPNCVVPKTYETENRCAVGIEYTRRNDQPDIPRSQC